MNDERNTSPGTDVPEPPRPDDPPARVPEPPTPPPAKPPSPPPTEAPSPHLPLPPPYGATVPPPRDEPRGKSPALAVLLSIAPGLGHLYVGAYQRAVMIVTAFFLAIYLLPLPISVFIPAFIWFFGLFDAYRLAQLDELSHRPPEERSAAHAKGTLAFGVFLAVVGLVILADNLFGIDLDWLRDWWPAILVLAGAYFIVEAVRERVAERRAADESSADDGLGGE